MRSRLPRSGAGRPARRPIMVAALLLGVVALGGLVYSMFQVVSFGLAWRSVERVSLDDGDTTEMQAGRPGSPADPVSGEPPDEESPSPPSAPTTTPTDPTVTTETSAGTPIADGSDGPGTTSASTVPGPTTTTTAAPTTTRTLETADVPTAPEVVLMVGIDSRAGLDDLGDFGDFETRNADVIVLAVRRGERITLVSLPRDLYVTDRCHGGRHRIGEAMAGCGETHGLANLVFEVEDVTGLDVAHAAAVDLAGFQKVVDSLGGYEICTEYALRDAKSGLDLAAGCTDADGATTLAWIRSRSTQQHIDGRWRTVPAVSDLTRNARQRRFVVDVFERLTTDNAPAAVLDLFRDIAPHLTVDDGLSLRRAAVWAWRFRGSDIETMGIPVVDHRTAGGAAVLLPTVDIADHIGSATG